MLLQNCRCTCGIKIISENMKYVYINFKYVFQTAAIWSCLKIPNLEVYLPLPPRSAAELFLHVLQALPQANCSGRTAILFPTDQMYSFNFIPITINISCSQSILHLKNIIPKIRSKAHKSKVRFLGSLFAYVLTLNIRFTS